MPDTRPLEVGVSMRATLERAGERVLVSSDDGRGRTGAELASRVRALARLLVTKRLSTRRVGVWYQNSIAALEAHLAVEWAGATRVPVDPVAPPSEAMRVFDAASVDLVLADASRAGALGGDVLVHELDAPAGTAGALEPIWVTEDTVLHLFPRTVAGGVMYGVPVTYGNWGALMRVNQALFRSGVYGPPLSSEEVFMSAQQLLHGTSMIGAFPFLQMGLPQVILRKFSGDRALETILRYGVTSTMFVPGMVTRLAEAAGHRETTELPLRRLLYGGAPFEREAFLRAINVLGSALVQLYGRWEGGWPIAVLSGEDHLRILAGDESLIGSCGLVVNDVEVQLRPVGTPNGTATELCVRSPMVVRAYADLDGWYGLGDLARLDERGYLFLEGRIDRQISSGAYHVYPGEIEEALLGLPSVHAARVVGEPDPTWGEAVVAYIVPETGAKPDANQIRDALRERLAAYKVPKRVHLVAASDIPDPYG